MKDLSFILFIVSYFVFLSHLQAQEKRPFIEFSQTNFSIGSTYGIHPNYSVINNVGYYISEFDSRLKIASFSLNIIGRISNEKYRSGVPSYCHVSYDASAQRKIRLSDLNDSIAVIRDKINLQEQKVYELEGKLSYLKQKQVELPSAPSIPGELPTLSLDSQTGTGNLTKSDIPTYKLSILTKSIDSKTGKGKQTKPDIPSFQFSLLTKTIDSETHMSNQTKPDMPNFQFSLLTKTIDSITGMETLTEPEVPTYKLLLTKTIDLETRMGKLRKPEMPNDQLSIPTKSIDLETRMGKLSKPDMPKYQLPNPTKSIDSITNIENLSKPDVPKDQLSQMNSTEISALENQLQKEKSELDKIKVKKQELEQLHNQLAYKKSLGFLDGIKKVDFGLSSLSSGSLSKNAIPMKGVHVAGVVHRFFYDAAAGFTMPNQLFSTSAFDQVINNNTNVFNAGNFFKVQTVRFVSSCIVGFGEKDKKAVSIENFYKGRTMKQIRGKETGLRSLTSNFNACYTLKRFPTVTLNGVIGYSNYFNDTLQRKDSDKLAYGGGIVIGFTKISGLLKANYRTLGSSYDGFSQGIYINGSEHFDASFKKEFGRKISVNVRCAIDKFHANDSVINLCKTQSAGLDLNWKIIHNTALYGSYTLVNAISAQGDQNLSHLIRSGIYSIKHIKHTDWVNSADAGYALVAGLDSNQVLTQGTIKSEVRFKKWFFSAKGTYQNMIGLARIYGVNWIYQPEIGIKLPDFEVGLSYQFMRSEQFHTSNGFQGYFLYKPSEYLTWSISATKWLASDYIFFMPEMTSYQKPYYIRFKLLIHLNVNK